MAAIVYLQSGQVIEVAAATRAEAEVFSGPESSFEVLTCYDAQDKIVGRLLMKEVLGDAIRVD